MKDVSHALMGTGTLQVKWKCEMRVKWPIQSVHLPSQTCKPSKQPWNGLPLNQLWPESLGSASWWLPRDLAHTPAFKSFRFLPTLVPVLRVTLVSSKVPYWLLSAIHMFFLEFYFLLPSNSPTAPSVTWSPNCLLTRLPITRLWTPGSWVLMS